MKNLFKKIFQPRINYQPLIEVRIFKNAILNNLQEFQKTYPKLQFTPVLKSNAYGHGLAEVAKILDIQNNLSLTLPSGGEGNSTLPFFMVDSFYEALVLRRAGISSKILILGFTRTSELLSVPLKNCSATIIDLEILKKVLLNLKKPARFHLKIDTGMHRQGILIEQVSEAIKLIKTNRNFILEGLCSHFADADGLDSSFTERQIEQWNKVVKLFRENFLSIKYFHTSNTAGNRFADKIDANVSRLGLGLYGIDPSGVQNLNLVPALEMVSVISSIKNIPAGEKVGYGGTFESSVPMRVATVPVGYNEGVDRRLSNKGSYKVGNIFCPIVGRVSMNMSSIDISECSAPIYRLSERQPINGHATTVTLESEVTVISANKTDKNSVENIAKLCDSIPYEVLVKIPQYLKRVIL